MSKKGIIKKCINNIKDGAMKTTNSRKIRNAYTEDNKKKFGTRPFLVLDLLYICIHLEIHIIFISSELFILGQIICIFGYFS